MDKRDKLIKFLKVSLEVAEKEIKKLREKNLEIDKEKLKNKVGRVEIEKLLRVIRHQRTKLKKSVGIDGKKRFKGIPP